MSVASPTLGPRPKPSQSPSALLALGPQNGWRHLSRAIKRTALLVLGDAAVLLLAAVLLNGGRNHGWFGSAVSGRLAELLPPGALPADQLIGAVLLCLVALGTYDPANRRQALGRRLAGTGLGLALPYWGPLWSDFSPPLLSGFVLIASVITAALLLGRMLVDAAIDWVIPGGSGPAQVLLVAHPHDAERALEHPGLADPSNYVVRGIFDPEVLRRGQGAAEALREAIAQSGADTVVLCCGPLGNQAFETLLDVVLSAECQLVGVTRSCADPGTEPRVVWSHGAPVVLLTRPAERTGRLALKRMIDVLGAVVGLVLFAPVMMVVALAIRLESPGPIIFAQRRLGGGGRPFRFLKFRTMRADAEAILHRDPELFATFVRNGFKLPRDQDLRITRVGDFLRQSSLDELPQLWNVLRGEMSLVGPRPVEPEQLTQFGEGATLLLALKPGMAGAWAVNGRSRVGFPARANIELNYVRNWRLGLDLSILARVLPAVISRRGAH